MTLESLLKDYTAYNLWANTCMVDWLKAQPAELMTREVPSSFPDLHQTLLHIWGAEKLWLERLQQVPTEAFLTQTFKGSTDDVFEGILKTSANFNAYTQALSGEHFQENCPFRLLDGTEDARPRSYMIHHCMNHSTYHRGQIVTMARNLGLADPPSTDFIRYVRLQNA